MEKERVWLLLAKKLAGEISEKELELLSAILNNHPELQYKAWIITTIWKEKNITEEETDAVGFKKIMERIKEQERLNESGHSFVKRNFMITNYLKTAFRNLQNNKIFSVINITGLAIGLSVCMLIVLYVGHESSYDSFHKNASRIVWIQGKMKMGNDSIFMPRMSYATGPVTNASEPFVEDFVRLKSEHENPVIQNPQSPSLKFSEKGFLFADSNFFKFFTFRLVKGNNQHVLKKPFTVVITEKVAKKYFGNEDPVGKIIRYNNEYNFTVTGIAGKIPSNSSITYDFVASMSSIYAINETKKLTESQNVQLGAFSTYFLLKHPQDATLLETSLQKLSKSVKSNTETNERFIATPLTEIHLNANYTDASNTKYLKIFPFVALLILLLALINYISLSTAQSSLRAKEIGVRKVMGADRKGIATQFFIESALYTAVSFGLAYFLCFLVQPVFFNFLQIDIDTSFLYNSKILLSFGFLFISTVLIAATYPALLLSAFKPVAVLYGKFSKRNSGLSMRKFFTVFQFSVSVLLIICGIVIREQMNFFRHTDTGVDRENVVMIPFAPTIGKHYSAFKKEVQSLATVQQTTTARYPMYKGTDIFFTKVKNSNVGMPLPIMSVDENFIPLLGLKWKMRPADSLVYQSVGTVILNEAAVEKLSLGNEPLNEKFSIGDDEVRVAGVLKDFNYQSLQNKIGALCIFVARDKDSTSVWGDAGGCFFAKIGANADMPLMLSQLKTIYEKYETQKTFEYYFLDETFESMYKAEDRLSKILNAFIVFTLVIACLGLFGLSTFVVLQRTREVGVRKVLGASVRQVTVLLSRDFVKPVFLAIFIASPLAWIIMHKWLERFPYRINISWWEFVTAAVIALVIALLTISFQTIKAAVAKPVKSLRTE